MNLAEMERRLGLIVRDPSLEPEFAGMINDAIGEIAADFDLPALKLLTPHSFPVTTADWLYFLPDTYHKRLFRVRDGNGDSVRVVRTLEDLDLRDADHDEIGTRVTHAAVMDTGVLKHLGIYPKADGTLKLWFYCRPAYLSQPDDSCDCIPPEFQERVIFPKIIIKNYQLLLDQVENFDVKPLQYWEGKLTEGLYGRRGGPIGLINWIAKLQGGPRRHGGRDPIGARG